MKKLIFITTLFISSYSWNMHHEKVDPIFFAIDFNVIAGKEKEAKNFTYKIAKKVKNTEPLTIGYEYSFSPDGTKMYLLETYRNNTGAITHMENFVGSKWEKEFFEYFELKSFSVLGNSNEKLKKSLKDYTNDFRTLEGGFHRLHERVKKRLN